jgi:hypothetical protein
VRYLLILVSLSILSSCASQTKMSRGKLLNEAKYESLNERGSSVQCPSTPSEKTDTLVEQTSQCTQAKNWKKVEEYGRLLAANASESGWGAYFLSLSAEHTGQLDRAVWMADLAIKKEPGRAIFYYQKARVLGLVGDEAGQQKALELGFSQEPDIAPFMLLAAKKSYANGDCAKLIHLGTTKSLAKTGTGAVLTAECLAIEGRLGEAHAILDSFLKQSPNHAEVLIQKARIEETFAANFTGAVELYRQVQRSTQKPDLLAWLKNKLEYLEGSSTLQKVRVSAKGE